MTMIRSIASLAALTLLLGLGAAHASEQPADPKGQFSASSQGGSASKHEPIYFTITLTN